MPNATTLPLFTLTPLLSSLLSLRGLTFYLQADDSLIYNSNYNN